MSILFMLSSLKINIKKSGLGAVRLLVTDKSMIKCKKIRDKM